MIERIFVTGGSGQFGLVLVDYLKQSNYLVRALTRNKKAMQKKFPGVDWVEGNLETFSSVYLAGFDCVIHAAAETYLGHSSYQSYYLSHVQNTERLLNAAYNAGIRNFVYIGTANCMQTINTVPNAGQLELALNTFYARSKKEAASLVLNWQDRMRVVLIHPSLILSVNSNGTSSGRVLQRALWKRFIFYPPGGKSFIDARDCATGVLRAMQNAPNGAEILLSCHNLTFKELYQKFNSLSPQKSILIKIPYVFLFLAGILGSVLKRFGIYCEWDSKNLRMISSNYFYQSTNSGVPLRPIKETILDWIKVQKCLLG